ncbi:hypothetical protein KW801_00395 [Candidatus Saccharibacteria bacterium]|nr:hypothetical protein [Candidatus Saccharibacteria bacterium]
MKKLFELHQKITLLVNEYHVLVDGPDGQQQTAGFVKQKRFALREQFSLYKDESQQEVVASSKARSVLDFGAIYDVFDSKNQPIAALKKDFKRSLLISTWQVYDAQMKTPLFTLHEKSQFMAIFRRLWELLPYLNDFPFPIKYHFVIKSDDTVVGEYIKITRFRDHYALYMNDEAAPKLDIHAWMILAVLLDAMQSR